MKTLLLSTSVLVTVLAIALPAQGQVLINWGPVTGMQGDLVANSDLKTNGTYFDAVNTADNYSTANFVTTNVDGTAFNALVFSTPSSGTDGAITVSGDLGTFTNIGYGTGSTAYKYVVSQGSDASAGSVTIGSLSKPLVVGNLYQVEVWSVWPYGPYQGLVAGNPPAAFDYAATEYSIGTFTATETTETFTWTGGNNVGATGFLNDISVRDLSSVPEPGAWAMMLGGIGFLFFVRRLRRAC